jgi:hypothetical protein
MVTKVSNISYFLMLGHTTRLLVIPQAAFSAVYETIVSKVNDETHRQPYTLKVDEK